MKMSQFTRFKQNYKASLTFFILGAVKVNSMILINISPSLAQTQQKLNETLPTEIDLFKKKKRVSRVRESVFGKQNVI